jgi:anti-anti-sigma factor
MPVDFDVAVKRNGEAVVVAVHGELDIATAPRVEEAVRTALQDGASSSLELDWSGLTFMDSTGIRLLFRLVKLGKQRSVDLTWRLSSPAQRALDAVGIHDSLLRSLGE